MKAVTVSLSNVGASLKSSANQTGDAAALANFNVFFADDAGKVYYGKNPDGTDATHYSASSAASMTFHFLDPAVNKAVVVANMGDLGKGFTLVSEIKAKTVAIANQQDKDVATLVMYGESESLDPTGAHTDTHPSVPVYKAEVEIAPLVARIEVMTFGVSFDENKFKSVTFETLAFDNYYTTTTLAGVSGSDPLDGNEFGSLSNDAEGLKTALKSYFARPENVGQWYYDNLLVTLNPEQKIVVTSAKTQVSLTDGHRYAYHFFPNKSVTYFTKNGYPRLCAKVTTENHAGLTKDQYVITGRILAEGVAFEPGKIYRVNYVFPESKLEGDMICADVEISVKEWDVVTVTPDWN